MPINRRALLGVGAIVVGGGIIAYEQFKPESASVLAPDANAASPAAPLSSDPRMANRALGQDNAPVQVAEWFSLTCPHCAAFHRDTLPQVRTGLIDTGKLRLEFHDYPLDKVALMAAMVARSLPPERYEPFVSALFQTQDRWAFARDVNSTEELAKMAALAGLPRDKFDAAINDTGLRDTIVNTQSQATNFYHIDSTPSFIFNGAAQKDHLEAGERSYADFAKLVANAAGTA